MSTFGSINHMIVTLRNNAKLLHRKRVFKKGAEFFKADRTNYKTSEKGIPSEPVSKDKLLEIKHKIQNERRSRRKRMFLFLIIAFPLSVLLIYYTFKDYEFGLEGQSNTHGEMMEKEEIKKDQFLFYLTDGDKWLEKKNYYNAIFQYKNAIGLYPSEYTGQYRLALAYSYQCQYEFEGCEKGMALIEKLEKQFPNEKELQETKAVFEHWATP